MSVLTVSGYKLSPQQKHIYSTLKNTGGQPFRVQIALKIEGELDQARLWEAFGQVVTRHEILRTTFQYLPELTAPLQVVNDDLAPEVREFDLTRTAAGLRDRAIDTLFRKVGEEPFDLEHGPVLRLYLINLLPQSHALVVCLHALCGDAVTVRNIIREAFLAYDGRLPDDQPMQYADVAEWRNELLQSEDAKAGVEYWRREEFREPENLRLPFERKNLKPSGFSPELVRFSLSPDDMEKIPASARLQNQSPSLIFLACWYALLWRLIGQSAPVIGVSHPGRDYSEFENAAGPFARYLPARAVIDEETSFAEFLKRLRQRLDESEEWQECFSPEYSGDEEFSGRENYLSFLFDYDRWDADYSAGGLRIQPAAHYVCLERFKIRLSFASYPDSMFFELHYDPSLFSREEIELLGNQYLALLDRAAADCHSSLLDLDAASGAETRKLLEEFNYAESELFEPECVHHLIERQAKAQADSVALIYDEQMLTYSDLDRRATLLARYLQRSGVGPEKIVALYLRRSPEMVIGILGALKAGGAYLPIDDALPEARVSLLLAEARPEIILTDSLLKERLGAHNLKTVCLDTDWDKIAARGRGKLSAAALPQNLAYILFTSGSTGKPKGVMVEHRQLINYVKGISARLPVSKAANYAMVSTFAADLGNTVLFPSLCNGGRLHLISQRLLSDPSALADYFTSHRIDCLKITPSHLMALQTIPNPEQVLPRECLVVGGEPSYWNWVIAIQRKAPECVVINHYGPTEATVGTLTYQVEKAPELRASTALPLGKPIANTQVHLLDASQRLVPIWRAGEIHIGGRSLARGYLNHPGLTAERFIPNSFSDRAGSRLYKTGDLARRMADGTMDFLGRKDRQVKIHGFRVEIGEIESVIRQHPSVHEALVIDQDDPPVGKRLIAYVVPKEWRVGKRANGRVCRLPNGTELSYINKYEVDFLYKEIFEDRVYLKNGINIEEGDCIFDVGANIGLFALYVAQHFPNTKIYSFEPIKPIFEALRSNLERVDSDAKAFNVGVSSAEREVEFTFYPFTTMCSGMYSDLVNGRPHEIHRCYVKRLSSIIKEEGVERIDLLKIDVEKSEFDVLEGIDDSDWAKIRQLVIEVHNVSGRLDRVIKKLKKLAYKVTADQSENFAGSEVYTVYAVKSRPVASRARARNRPRASGRPHAVERPALTEGRLTQYLKERLPGYMVPSATVFLDKFPLTSNGKIDRGALPLPGQRRAAALEGPYIAPRDEIERRLVRLWEELLSVKPIGVRDKFFELGGHSLLALQMMVRIRQEFEQEISPETLLQTATIEKLAESLRKNSILDEWSPLVELRAQGTGTPLFLAHPVTGNAYCYFDLVSHLPDRWPVYGLQARLFAPQARIEEMASSYIEAVLTVQPHGPYLLGGWSMGGIIACEMALQLIARGEEVALLAVIDKDIGVPQDAKDEATLRAMFVETIDVVREQLIIAGRQLPDIHPTMYRTLYKLFRANHYALEAYQPKFYPGKVAFFRAQESLSAAASLSGGWDSYARDLETFEVPGDHSSMLIAPHAQVLAALLDRCLEKASASINANKTKQRRRNEDRS